MELIKQAESLVSKFNFLSMKAHDIAVSLMTRALKRGDEESMMERITFHFNRAHDMPEEHRKGVALALIYDEKCGKSQTLRKASMKNDAIFEDNSIPKPTVH